MRRVQVLKVVRAELDGGVGIRLHLSHSGIPSFIPGKGSICTKRKNTLNILHRIMNIFYTGQGLLN